MRVACRQFQTPLIALAAVQLLGACAGGGKSDVADASGIDAVDAAPAPPDSGGDPQQNSTGPHAWAVSASQINLVWRANTESDLAGYRIYRDGTPIATIGGNRTTYSDQSVMPATMYAYNLTAFDVAGNESTWTPTLRATTPPGTMPPLGFASDVFPILQSHCSSCHAAYAASGTAYTRIKSVASGSCAGRQIIIPGNASMSLLYQNVTGTLECGETRSPAALPSAQARIIGGWINQGGLDN